MSQRGINLLPPKHLIEEWRLAGLSPQQIYAKCEEFDKARRQAPKPPKQKPERSWRKLTFLWRKWATVNDLSEIANCEGCKSGKGRRQGLCEKHYKRLLGRKRRESKNAPEGAEVRDEG